MIRKKINRIVSVAGIVSIISGFSIPTMAKANQLIIDNQPELSDSVSAFVTNTEEKIGDFTYQLLENENGERYAKIVSCNNKELTNINIESVVTASDGKNYDIKYIGKQVFKDMTNLSKIKIGKLITDIYDSAFSGCRKLESVDFSNAIALNYIGNGAFKNCEWLTEIQLPKSLTKIGQDSFSGCSRLENISLNEGLISIDINAFYGTRFTKLTLPKSITSMGSVYGAALNGSSVEEITLSSETTTIPEGLLNCETSKISKLIVPNTVTKIGKCAFGKCSSSNSLKITFMGKDSDSNYDTTLENLILPDNIKEIGEYAFDECTQLKSIKYSEDIKLNNNAFYRCTNLSEIVIPSSMTEISSGLFNGCESLNNVKINGKITTIKEDAFANCLSLKKLDLPETVETIEEGAFQGCPCELNFDVLLNLKSIGPRVFGNNSNYYSENNCLYKKNLNPEDYERVVENGHYGTLSSIAKYYGTDSNVELTPTFNQFSRASIIDVKAFANNETIQNIKIYDDYDRSITYVADRAFSSCPNLNTVELRGSIKYMGSEVFKDCTRLQNVILTDARQIGISAFENCTALTEITMPRVTCIKDKAFYNCSSLSNVEISKDITEIGQEALVGTKINEISLENTTNIQTNSFNEGTVITCEGFKYTIDSNGIAIIGVTEDKIGDDGVLNIPSTLNGQPVVSIAKESFKGNTKVKKVVINSENINIGEEAFRGCTELASIEIKGKVNAIGDRAFYSCDKIGDTIKLSRSSIDGKVVKSVFDGSSITKIQIGDDYVYSFASEDTIKLVSYIGGEATPTIPETMNQNKLTTIGAGAFKDNAKITKVSLSNNIEIIEDDAFFNCTSLKGIVAPQAKYVGLNILGQTACETSLDNNSGLKYINIGNSAIVTGYINPNDTRTKLEIPAKLGNLKVISINYRAFAGNTNIQQLVVPSSIVSISDEAFDGCANLVGTIPSNITVGPNTFRNNIERKTSGDYSYYVIGNTIEIVKYTGKDKTIKEITIPEEIEGKKVTRIAANAFLGYTNLEVVTNFNKGVKTNIKDVENDAFLGTALINKIYNNYIYNPTTGTIIGYIGTNSEIIIPAELNGSKIYVIGEGAFKDNANLTKVTISSGITKIESKAFSNCQNLKTVEKPSTITSEVKDAYEGSTNINNTNQGSETEQKPQDQTPQETGDNTKLPIVATILSLVGIASIRKKENK